MKKLLIAAVLMLPMMLCCSSSGSGENAGSGSESAVYICTGKTAKKYHKSADCKGLRNCKGDIVKMDKSRAEAMGKTPCRICY